METAVKIDHIMITRGMHFIDENDNVNLCLYAVHKLRPFQENIKQFLSVSSSFRSIAVTESS